MSELYTKTSVGDAIADVTQRLVPLVEAGILDSFRYARAKDGHWMLYLIKVDGRNYIDSFLPSKFKETDDLILRLHVGITRGLKSLMGWVSYTQEREAVFIGMFGGIKDVEATRRPDIDSEDRSEGQDEGGDNPS